MDNGDIVLGVREPWGAEQPFGLTRADRRQHVYVIGKSGVGKTTLLRNMIVQDIYHGHGVGLIDPHGDLATELLDCVPRSRIEDVVVFNPADVEHPVGFNVLGRVPPSQRHLVASGVVSAFKSIWSESWGPRLEYILYASVAALLDCENVSLLGVQRLLSDGRYRRWVMKQVRDPMVRSFWMREYENYPDNFLREAISPIQNKVGQLLMSPHLRNILGQVRTRIKARHIMDRGQIFIADLSKGKIGPDKSALMGAFLVSEFQLAAMTRADVPESKRRDFFLYADEFQSVMSDAFVSVLSEARKYRLCLTLSHQYIEQVRPEIRNAVFGNVGSLVSFRVGQRDAEELVREFGAGFTQSQFTGLGNHEILAKLLTHGHHGEAFFGRTLPPLGKCYGHRETIVRRSRQRFSRRQNEIEGKIERWLAG